MREQIQVKRERAVLVGPILLSVGAHRSDNLTELTALAETAGAVVVDKFQQKIRKVSPATYIGSGKVKTLAERVQKYQADVVIFDADLSPGQIRQLEEAIGKKVVDRSELILDIFATRAQTRQARLQVELAQLEYTYPRLTRMWSHLDNVVGAGGATTAGAVGAIGTRGTGEKQLEIDRRLVTRRITDLREELASIDKRILREIDGRKDFFKICVVGYTNAGKSTLMNALTDAGVLVEDKLFATLDTRTRRWALEAGTEVLLSDTVGFVSRLPHHLVASFKATLEEAINADLLLHVVDTSNQKVFEQIESVETVLKDIGCGQKDTLILLNKADILSGKSILESVHTVYPDALCISAKTGLNLDKLARAVLDRYHGRRLVVTITCSAGDGRTISFLHANTTILQETYAGNTVTIEASIGQNQLATLKRLGVEITNGNCQA